MKKILSVIIALCLVLSFAQVSSFALGNVNGNIAYYYSDEYFAAPDNIYNPHLAKALYATDRTLMLFKM